jgi:hypothetical protein
MGESQVQVRFFLKKFVENSRKFIEFSLKENQRTREKQEEFLKRIQEIGFPVRAKTDKQKERINLLTQVLYKCNRSDLEGKGLDFETLTIQRRKSKQTTIVCQGKQIGSIDFRNDVEEQIERLRKSGLFNLLN